MAPYLQQAANTILVSARQACPIGSKSRCRLSQMKSSFKTPARVIRSSDSIYWSICKRC